MVRFSNTVVGTLNVVTALISLAAIAVSVYFHVHGGDSTQCQRFVRDPLLITGVVLLVVSLIGIVGSLGRMNSFLYVYLGLMAVFVIGLIGFTVFSFMVTNEGAGRVVSGRGYKEYRLGDYSHWLQNHLVNQKSWREIRGCLIDANVCKDLNGKNNAVVRAADEFFKMNLSPIQSGCCKPPSDCGFDFRNATFWAITPASDPSVARDADCNKWSNDQKKLCYNCNACKAGFLANIRQHWRQLLVANVCMIVLVLAVYCIGCCASRNNRTAFKYTRAYP